MEFTGMEFTGMEFAGTEDQARRVWLPLPSRTSDQPVWATAICWSRRSARAGTHG